jgi:glycosyltransferase involved in cell wall biosynthesis
MAGARPEISVIIPVYNDAKNLRRAVLSVLTEQTANSEVIVVDDGSTDGSLGTIADLPVIRLQQANQGPAAARNLGVKHARAPFITFLDSDDVMAADSLAARIHILHRYPAVAAVGGYAASLMDELDRPMRSFRSLDEFWPGAPGFLTRSHYASGKFYPINVWLYVFRRDFCEQIGWFDPGLRVAEDLEFMFRVINQGVVLLENIPAVHRRLHNTNMSIRNDGEQIALTDETVTALQNIYDDYGYQLTSVTPWESRMLEQKQHTQRQSASSSEMRSLAERFTQWAQRSL